MRSILAFSLIAVIALAVVHPAYADQAEAREVARINNCPPKKIQVYQQSMGSEGTTVYQVDCNMPKAADKDAPTGPSGLLISCDGSLCEMLRPITEEKK